MNWKCDVVMDLASLYHDGVASGSICGNVRNAGRITGITVLYGAKHIGRRCAWKMGRNMFGLRNGCVCAVHWRFRACFPMSARRSVFLCCILCIRREK